MSPNHKGTKPPRTPTPTLLLAICVGGIYGCFLAWGYLQEKLTTTDYRDGTIKRKGGGGSSSSGLGGGAGEPPALFEFFIFMNLIQSLIACCCAAVYASFKGVDLSAARVPRDLGLLYLSVGLTSALASPFGYSSLAYINFPTLTLSKSCKLVPVMAVQVLVYRKRYPWYKYLSVALITAGVSSFFLLQPSKGDDFAANSLYGLLLVTANLLLDGFTNSTEDVIFSRHRISSTQLMFFLNLAQAFLMALYLLNPWNPELSAVFHFFTAYPQSLVDLLVFSLAGALGQMVVFFTLEQFGALTLVTITVTRKLFSIVLSIVAFQHHMSLAQIVSVCVVFFGIGLEAVMKERQPHKSHGH